MSAPCSRCTAGATTLQSPRRLSPENRGARPADGAPCTRTAPPAGAARAMMRAPRAGPAIGAQPAQPSAHIHSVAPPAQGAATPPHPTTTARPRPRFAWRLLARAGPRPTAVMAGPGPRRRDPPTAGAGPAGVSTRAWRGARRRGRGRGSGEKARAGAEQGLEVRRRHAAVGRTRVARPVHGQQLELPPGGGQRRGGGSRRCRGW